jgi:hypothetical protein
MGEQEFVSLCKREVVEYVNRKYQCGKITEKDVYVVWLCKALQNNKALLSTTVEDGMYYEITHNGNAGELYVDAYQKVSNYAVVI